MLIANKRVACEPIDKAGPVTEGKKGYLTVRQQPTLIAKVAFASSDPLGGAYLVPGDTIVIEGNDYTAAWFKDKLEIGGKQVILVPLERVLAFELTGERLAVPPTSLVFTPAPPFGGVSLSAAPVTYPPFPTSGATPIWPPAVIPFQGT